jgi:hypothetical protein
MICQVLHLEYRVEFGLPPCEEGPRCHGLVLGRPVRDDSTSPRTPFYPNNLDSTVGTLPAKGRIELGQKRTGGAQVGES